MTVETQLDAKRLQELEKKYDTSLNLRDHGPVLGPILYWGSIAFAAYHVWTAGFGTPVDHVHMGLHLAGLFVLVVTGFPLVRTAASQAYGPRSALKPGNVPLYDWALITLGVAASLFLWVSWRGFPLIDVPAQTLRQGNPTGIDVFFGTILIIPGPFCRWR